MNKYQQPKLNGSATVSGRHLKTEGYSSDTLHAKRDRKRQEAEARQRECDGRTTEERLMNIASRRGKSKREATRLLREASSK